MCLCVKVWEVAAGAGHDQGVNSVDKLKKKFFLLAFFKVRFSILVKISEQNLKLQSHKDQ